MTHLTFGFDFNQSISNYVPITTKLSNLISRNEQPKTRILPENLTELNLNDTFNQPLDKDTLPTNLRRLKFGISFNQPLNNVLPKKLTHLTLGFCFDQSLDDVLPDSLTHLYLHHRYMTRRKLDNKIKNRIIVFPSKMISTRN